MSVEEVLRAIIKLCIQFGAEQAFLFGSRAKGTNLERSDIDIAVQGVENFYDLKEKIDDLPTLYMVDLLNMDKCHNEAILEDIRLYGREIYKKIP